MRKFKNEVDAPTAGEGPTHIHNYTPSETTPIFARAVVGAIAIFVGWHVLVFLFDQMGILDPGRALAQVIIWGIIIAAFIFVAGRWLDGAIANFYKHRQAMADKETERMRYQQIMLNSMAKDTRRLGDDQRLAALILSVMEDAYDQLARSGKSKFAGLARPWSRRSAGSVVLTSLGEVEPVGDEFGRKARQFLQDQHIIIGDQINLRHFPDLAAVQIKLYQPPVLPLRNNSTIKNQ
ncbi:MAG: hypothetical protein ACYTEQ_09520 [Planctomycetota bacterium]|jgi:hypothetical protein